MFCDNTRDIENVILLTLNLVVCQTLGTLVTRPNTKNDDLLFLVSNEALEQMRARAIDTRTMMTLSGDEVEHLILNSLVQPVLNRKNDIGLEFPCGFCNWYNANYNVPIRSFSRKEEIKRHHMLHLNYDRHTCQLCDYKVLTLYSLRFSFCSLIVT